MTATALSAIATLVQARSGIVLGEDKGYMLETRLAPLLRRHGLRDLQLLASRLQGGVGEGSATSAGRGNEAGKDRRKNAGAEKSRGGK